MVNGDGISYITYKTRTDKAVEDFIFNYLCLLFREPLGADG